MYKHCYVVSLLFRIFIPIKSKHWVFGADHGYSYCEGSKYLLEFMLENHRSYKCTFITKNKSVFRDLKNKGIPCEYNYSVRGLFRICESDCCFFTQDMGDISFVPKNRKRSLFYLVHGQPFKIALRELNRLKPGYCEATSDKLSISKRIQNYILSHFYKTYDWPDIDFVSATSEFEASFQRKEFHDGVDIKILGMPRNDALFQPNRMKDEKWIKGLDGKRVVTYMPTHRLYGHGQVSPIPFLDRQDVQQWMREHEVVLLVKQHPNMARQHIFESHNSDVIRDISLDGYDPQVVIYHSDILITDYSSVWIDYLLLKRPLIFYFYDKFEKEDAGTYYDLRKEFPNNFCENEDSLFSMIKESICNPTKITPSDKELRKYHLYVDGHSCQRYYDEIVRRKY